MGRNGKESANAEGMPGSMDSEPFAIPSEAERKEGRQRRGTHPVETCRQKSASARRQASLKREHQFKKENLRF